MFNECLHGKQMKNGLFFSLIVLLKSFCLRSSIKHLTQCFITRWNTSKFVKNTPLIHLVMKHCVSYLINYITLRTRTSELFRWNISPLKHIKLLFLFWSPEKICLWYAYYYNWHDDIWCVVRKRQKSVLP